MAPECVLMVAARIAARMRPTRPGGIRWRINVGKMASGVENTRAW